jgi:hypothetical protein
MRLKSFGCSFIFGTDLSDAVAIPGIPVVPSQTTWPAHLACRLGHSYNCYARPGSGNLQIVECILNQVADSNSSDLFVIGWTWIDRFDYWNVNYNPRKDLTAWSTIMPVDTTDLAKTYYRDLHSEYRDKFTSLCNIKLAIDTLNQQGIPFVMTCMDQLLFDQRWHVSKSVLDLQSYIKPHMTMFEDQTFLDWSRDRGFEISPSLHPLESAHAAAADYLINHNLV